MLLHLLVQLLMGFIFLRMMLSCLVMYHMMYPISEVPNVPHEYSIAWVNDRQLSLALPSVNI